MKKFLILAAVISLFLSGCVERKLFVRTDPSAADFYFDDKHIGQTPLEFDFEWYWTHSVRVEKSGYEPLEKNETIKARPYLWIPIDFLVEILPFKVKDYYYLEYKLTKTEEPETQKIKEGAAPELKTEPQENKNSDE